MKRPTHYGVYSHDAENPHWERHPVKGVALVITIDIRSRQPSFHDDDGSKVGEYPSLCAANHEDDRDFCLAK